MTAFRRLKNVIVIMEWVPDMARVERVTPSQLGMGMKKIMSHQETKLARAFEMFNIGRKNGISIVELKEVLKAGNFLFSLSSSSS